MDRRDRINLYGKGWPEHTIDIQHKTITFIDMEDEEGNLFDIVLPFKFEVCPTCEGSGSHVNPSVDSHGLTAEDFYEDPDFAEDYHRGIYDVICHECGGANVVPEINREQIEKFGNEEIKNHLKLVNEYMESYWEGVRTDQMERRYGA